MSEGESDDRGAAAAENGHEAGRTASSRRAYRGPVFLSQAFRPMFLAAGLWSAVVAAGWLHALAGGPWIPSALDALSWHVHEMIFGFAAAAMGGFLLTAIPNWTGRLPVQGGPLAALALSWLAGRVAVAVSDVIGAAPAAVVDLVYLTALTAVALREILSGRNLRNLPIVAIVGVLAVCNLLIHLEATGLAETAALGQRLAIADIAVLVSLIGGRVVPSFTRNWLAARHSPSLPVVSGRLDRAVLAITAIAGLGWAFFPDRAEVGVLALLAGVVHALRLSRWLGWRTLSEPLVWVLHLGYLWLALGFVLLGLSLLVPALPPTAALHALTTGAFGTMILAVMTRASLGHGGRALHAGLGTASVYVLVTLAAALRVVSPLAGAEALATIMASGVLWIAAFALFVALYLPLFLGLRPRR